MVYKLNILHLLIALGAAGCATTLLREARGRLLHPSRLFAAPLLAAVPALFLLAIVAPELREPRLWAAALALGALAGAARGFTMRLQVDHMWTLIRLPRGRDGLWAAAALGGFAALATLLTLAGPEAGAYAALAAAGAAAGAGHLAGRAIALYLRTATAPHRDLVRW
jgi:hypothetical protein